MRQFLWLFTARRVSWRTALTVLTVLTLVASVLES